MVRLEEGLQDRFPLPGQLQPLLDQVILEQLNVLIHRIHDANPRGVL